MRATSRHTTSLAVGRCAGSAAQHRSISARYSLFMGVGRTALESAGAAATAAAAAPSLAALPSWLLVLLPVGEPRVS